MRTLLTTALGSVELLTAGQQMNVAVCNPDGVREPIIVKAKAETEPVFRSAGVTIVWGDCDAFPTPDALKRELWFFVRLRTEKPPLEEVRPLAGTPAARRRCPACISICAKIKSWV